MPREKFLRAEAATTTSDSSSSDYESDDESVGSAEFVTADEWYPSEDEDVRAVTLRSRAVVKVPRRVYVLTDSLFAGAEARVEESIEGVASIRCHVIRGAYFKDLVPLVEEVLDRDNDPAIIVILGGGNDIFPKRDRRRPPLIYTPGCQVAIEGYKLAKPVLKGIRHLNQCVRDHHKNSKIIFGTIPPRSHPTRAEEPALTGANAEVIDIHRTLNYRPVFLDRYVGRRRRGYNRARQNRVPRDGVHPSFNMQCAMVTEVRRGVWEVRCPSPSVRTWKDPYQRRIYAIIRWL